MVKQCNLLVYVTQCNISIDNVYDTKRENYRQQALLDKPLMFYCFISGCATLSGGCFTLSASVFTVFYVT